MKKHTISFIFTFTMLLPVSAYACEMSGRSKVLADPIMHHCYIWTDEMYNIKIKVKIIEELERFNTIPCTSFDAFFLAQVIESDNPQYSGKKIVIKGFSQDLKGSNSRFQSGQCGCEITQIGSEGVLVGRDLGETYKVKGWFQKESYPQIDNRSFFMSTRCP